MSATPLQVSGTTPEQWIKAALAVTVIDAQTFQVSIPSDSVLYKNSLLLQASEIEQVTTPDEMQAARALAAEIKRAVDSAEDTRVELTAPFLLVQRDLMSKTKAWRSDLETKIEELEGMIAGYIQREMDKAAEFKRAAEAEARRLREDYERILRAEQAQIAELQRQQREAEMRAQQLKTRATQAKAMAEAASLRKEQEALELERLEREPEPVVAIVAPAPTIDTRGVTVRPTYEITVTDVHALYRAHPELVTLEPRKALLNSLVSDSNGEIKIPGVEIQKVLKTSVRSAL